MVNDLPITGKKFNLQLEVYLNCNFPSLPAQWPGSVIVLPAGTRPAQLKFKIATCESSSYTFLIAAFKKMKQKPVFGRSNIKYNLKHNCWYEWHSGILL